MFDTALVHQRLQASRVRTPLDYNTPESASYRRLDSSTSHPFVLSSDSTSGRLSNSGLVPIPEQQQPPPDLLNHGGTSIPLDSQTYIDGYSRILGLHPPGDLYISESGYRIDEPANPAQVYNNCLDYQYGATPTERSRYPPYPLPLDVHPLYNRYEAGPEINRYESRAVTETTDDYCVQSDVNIYGAFYSSLSGINGSYRPAREDYIDDSLAAESETDLGSKSQFLTTNFRAENDRLVDDRLDRLARQKDDLVLGEDVGGGHVIQHSNLKKGKYYRLT